MKLAEIISGSASRRHGCARPPLGANDGGEGDGACRAMIGLLCGNYYFLTRKPGCRCKGGSRKIFSRLRREENFLDGGVSEPLRRLAQVRSKKKGRESLPFRHRGRRKWRGNAP